MKLLVKPLRNLDLNKLPLMQDRIEYIRCILGFPDIKSFARRLRSRPRALEKIILNNSEGWLKPVADNIVEILGVDAVWMLVGTGRPYNGDYSQFIYEKPDNGRRHFEKDEYDIGKRIRQVRIEQNMTLPVFGAALKIDPDKIQKVEKGLTQPSVVLVNRIVKVFGVLDPWLLRDEGRQYPAKR